jgi:uncharacterized protein (TIGR02145 family)
VKAKKTKYFSLLLMLSSVAVPCFSQTGRPPKKICAMASNQNPAFATVKIGNQTWSAQNISIHIEGSVCYENNLENCKTFGALYTYVQALAIAKKFPGWRLPTKVDVDTLIAFLGGHDKAGKELKVGGSSGFNALLAGYREAKNGKYYRINEQTGFWTSLAEDANTAWKFYLTIEEDNINFHPVYKEYGDSVRLIKIN